MEPISPELALVDPDLARRARALLPEPLFEHEREVRPVSVPSRARRPHFRSDLFVRVAASLAIPSIALNIAYVRADARSESVPTVAPAAAPTIVRSGRPPTQPTAAPPKGRHPKVERRERSGVAAAQFHEPRVSPAGAPIRWTSSGKPVAFDLILWRGHRRVADIWTKRRDATMAEVACGTKGGLAPGRYLWFVYPVLDRRARHYGGLLKWGRVDVSKRVGCRVRAASVQTSPS